jgi:Flp pilus assembly protein TadD
MKLKIENRVWLKYIGVLIIIVVIDSGFIANVQEVKAVWNLGTNLSEETQKDYSKDLEYYQVLVQKEPDNAEAHHQLGLFLGLNGQDDKALSELQKAINLKPNNATYHQSLGVFYANTSHNKNAIIEFNKAVELDPIDASTYFYLGLSLKSLGRYDEARAALKKSMKVLPDYGDRYKEITRRDFDYRNFERQITQALDSITYR